MMTAPFEYDEECYLICHCSQCQGKAWFDLDEIEVHLSAVDPNEGVELELINVGLS